MGRGHIGSTSNAGALVFETTARVLIGGLFSCARAATAHQNTSMPPKTERRCIGSPRSRRRSPTGNAALILRRGASRRPDGPPRQQHHVVATRSALGLV